MVGIVYRENFCTRRTRRRFSFSVDDRAGSDENQETRERQTEEGLKKTNCTTEQKRKIRRHADRKIEGQQMQDGEREEFDPVRRKFDVVYFYKGKVDRRRDGETTKERSRLINNGCQRRAFFGESIRTYKRNKKKQNNKKVY